MAGSCDYNIEITNLKYEYTKERKYRLDSCSFRISADIKVTCTDLAKDDLYDIWIEAKACINCKEIPGPPILAED